MHRLFVLVVAALAAAYIAGAIYFFRQEQWAFEPSAAFSRDVQGLHHPEAVLGVLQESFARQRFGVRELELVREALVQAPSFYQSPFFLATYHSRRLENTAVVRASFEAALERYPANGRLHFAYATWLIDSRTRLDGWQDPDDPTRLRDPMDSAVVHLRRSMELEHDLSWRALAVLDTHRVPPERWLELTPDDPLSRRHLIDALFRGGHLAEGFELLEQDVAMSEDVGVLRRAASLALEGGRPDLAIEAAQKWQARIEARRGASDETIEVALVVSRAYAKMGDEDSSSRELEDAVSRIETAFGPSSRVTLDALCSAGAEYLSRGQTFTAESFYAQAASRSPSYVPALLGLARSSGRSGDHEGAITRYEDVLRLEPDHEAARRELRAVLARASGAR